MTTTDYTNFVFTISGSFADAEALNLAVNTVAEAFSRGQLPAIIADNFKAGQGYFSRLFSYPIDPTDYQKLSTMQQFMFETARYISVYRFKQPIKSYSNQEAQLSPSKRAIMLKSSLADLAQGKKSIENKIEF